MSSALATKTETPSGTVAASALLRAVLAVKPVTHARYHPGVRLDWTEDALTVSAANLDVWASYRVESAVCESPGSVVVNAGLLSALAKTTGKATFAAGMVAESGPKDEDLTIVLRSEGGTTTLRTLPTR